MYMSTSILASYWMLFCTIYLTEGSGNFIEALNFTEAYCLILYLLFLGKNSKIVIKVWNDTVGKIKTNKK